ncbi:unnamed protein product [Staurois parvus]|uniref:Uncharacterized protein n=1 Tax=Staurois parvus TaxID=386267 RepID=A0ABN9B921_9NEOB|nr:unnamed protein product [Staurois parvus]
MVRVTSQGSKQEKSAEVRIKQGQQQEQEQERRLQDTGAQEKHTPRPRLQVWPSLKYTCIISFRCFGWLQVESLIAESTRWPALYCSPQGR